MLIHIYSNHASASSEKKKARTHARGRSCHVQRHTVKISTNENRSRPPRKCRLAQCGRTGHQPTHGSTVPKHRHEATESRAPTNPRKETAGAQSARTSASIPGPDPQFGGRSMASRVHGRRRFAMKAGEKRGGTYRVRGGWMDLVGVGGERERGSR